jgi:hypothetical protein
LSFDGFARFAVGPNTPLVSEPHSLPEESPLWLLDGDRPER